MRPGALCTYRRLPLWSFHIADLSHHLAAEACSSRQPGPPRFLHLGHLQSPTVGSPRLATTATPVPSPAFLLDSIKTSDPLSSAFLLPSLILSLTSCPKPSLLTLWFLHPPPRTALPPPSMGQSHCLPAWLLLPGAQPWQVTPRGWRGEAVAWLWASPGLRATPSVGCGSASLLLPSLPDPSPCLPGRAEPCPVTSFPCPC